MWPMCLTLTIILTFEFWRSNVTFTFDRTHDLDHGFSWSNFEIAISQDGRADWQCTKGVTAGHSWPWPWPFGDQVQVMDLPDSDRGDFSCRRAVDSSRLAVRCTRFDTMNALLWMAQNFGTFISRDTPNHWVYFDGYCKMTNNSQDTSSGLCVANSQKYLLSLNLAVCRTCFIMNALL